MKNIHLIPTYKPSRLHFDEVLFSSPNFQISKTINSDVEGRNLYITSDEEIKEGDWCLDKFNQRWKLEDKKLIAFDSKGMKRFSTDTIAGHECKKIILTTDGDLIKDCVQAIDDEFLEWFVKNPSCEKVEINWIIKAYSIKKEYRIVIPKQETLEEAAELYSKNISTWTKIRNNSIRDFIEGAQWQQEQFKNESTAHYIDRHIVEAMVEVVKQKMHSEEEVINIIYKIYDEMGISISLEDVLKQLKK